MKTKPDIENRYLAKCKNGERPLSWLDSVKYFDAPPQRVKGLGLVVTAQHLKFAFHCALTSIRLEQIAGALKVSMQEFVEHFGPTIERALEVDELLRERMPELTTALLGEPSQRTSKFLRFDEILHFQGQPEVNVVIVKIAGPHRGDWYGDIYAEGTDPLDFIGHYAGCSTQAEAIQWAELWLTGKLVPVPTYAPANLVGKEA